MHDQIIEYLAQYDILYKYHSSFKTKHSTDMCLLYLNDKILKSFDYGLLNDMILDLQKVFDHNLLLQKLRAIGFHDDTVMKSASRINSWPLFLFNISQWY